MLTAFALFLVVKGINRMKRKKAEEPAPPPEPTATEILLTEIRDELKKK
jgi:large conductance mechanosensitive channel